jgi:O-antigen ligase
VLAGRLRASDRQVGALIACLGLVIAGAVLQLIPLDRGVRQAISPASEAFLQNYDLAYSSAAALQAQSGASSALAAPSQRRPLSIDPHGTVKGVIFAASFTLLLAGLTRFFGSHGTGPIPALIIGFGVVLALVGIVQKAVLGDHAYMGMRVYGFWRPQSLLTTPFGPFINKNHFAGWMVMALPLAIGYFLALAKIGLGQVRRDWRSRLLWLSSSHGGQLQLVGFAIVIMTVSLAMTMSRSGIACFGIAVGVAAIFGVRGVSARAQAALIFALAGLLVVPFAWARVDLGSRFGAVRTESLQLRKDAWQATARIIGDYPLTGTGLNTYGTATLQYRPDRKTQHFDEAHNDYLQLASEGGVLLTVPAAAAAIFLVLGIRRRFRVQRDDTRGHWVRFGAATSLAAIALQSTGEFSLQMPGNAVLFVVVCAIALHDVPERAHSDAVIGGSQDTRSRPHARGRRAS